MPVEITNRIDMKLRFIPAGKFVMGSPETERSEPERQSNEGPQHEVTITRPFYAGIHEVTQEQFQRVMGKNPSHFTAARGGGPDHPVEQVLWTDADTFCRKLSELTGERAAGRVYRLSVLTAPWPAGNPVMIEAVFGGTVLRARPSETKDALDFGTFKAYRTGPHLLFLRAAGKPGAEGFPCSRHRSTASDPQPGDAKSRTGAVAREP